MTTRGLLIDFDGTLVDSVGPLRGLFLRFLAEQGLPGSEAEFDRLNGMAIREALPLLRLTHEIEASDEELWERYHAELHATYLSEVEPFPGAREFLEAAGAMGLRIAIVTSSTADLVGEFLARHNLEGLVHAVVTSDGLIHSKPDPAIYQRAMAELGLLPAEYLAIEDSTIGLTSALAAGIPTLAMVREGTLPDTPSGVMATVTTFEEVLQFAKNL